MVGACTGLLRSSACCLFCLFPLGNALPHAHDIGEGTAPSPKLGQRAGLNPLQQEDGPQEVQVSHRDSGGETAPANFKIPASYICEVVLLFPGKMHQTEKMAVTQKNFLQLIRV